MRKKRSSPLRVSCWCLAQQAALPLNAAAAALDIVHSKEKKLQQTEMGDAENQLEYEIATYKKSPLTKEDLTAVAESIIMQSESKSQEE
ncbi:hypothetical protein [Paenibacillus sp. TH7-28]